jgi:glutaminyl-peptide cyclotransferase
MRSRPSFRRRPAPLALALAFALVVAALLGCSSSENDPHQAIEAVERDESVERLRVEVVAEHPHDPKAFTQGLVVDGDRFYESTGDYGYSDVREVEVESGEVVHEEPLPPSLFGEGLAQVDDRLIQITWREHVARAYDRETLELIEEFSYDGEGWGLCYDGDRLVMSDGSATLTFRDPETFEEIGAVDVTAGGAAVGRLNELECVDGQVYANVYTTNNIIAIDPERGEVTASIDASNLLTPNESAEADVMNGIAHDAGSDTFFLTGKHWPTMFEVRFVAADDSTTTGAD